MAIFFGDFAGAIAGVIPWIIHGEIPTWILVKILGWITMVQFQVSGQISRRIAGGISKTIFVK